MKVNTYRWISIQMRLLLLALTVSAVSANSTAAQSLGSIQKSEIRHYVRLLRLDDDQAAVASLMHDEYYQRHVTDLRPLIRGHYEDSEDSRNNPAHPGVRTLVDQRTLRQEFLDLSEKRRDADAAFFQELASILKPAQVARIQRVLGARSRVLWKVGREELPEGNVDLVELLDGMQLDAGTADTVEEFILEFEPRFLQALQATQHSRVEAKLRYSTEARLLRRQLLADLEFLTPSQRADRQAVINELADRGGRIRTPAAKRLRDLNRYGFQQLMEILPEDDAALLRDQYLQISYPEIESDASSASQLYDAAESIETLTPEQHDILATMRSAFTTRHETLSQMMRESDMRRREASHRAKAGEDAKLINDEWRTRIELGLQRQTLNEKQGAVIRAVLDPEQAKLLPKWDFTENPPPRPWDPWWRPERRRREREHRR